MPWIQNVSRNAIKTGQHKDPGENSLMIQIIDPAAFFPEPKYKFKEIHQFEFLDAEQDDDFDKEFKITPGQADQLVKILKHALNNNMNVIVHCNAGLCRSGSICEIGVMMGFEDTGVQRTPNLLVKHTMMDVLGWLYD